MYTHWWVLLANALAEFIRSLSLNINVTFDEYPTDGSNNAVKSSGIKEMLDSKADKSSIGDLSKLCVADRDSIVSAINSLIPPINDINLKQDILTFDNEPTYNSDNPITSGGVYDELELIRNGISDNMNTIGNEIGAIQLSLDDKVYKVDGKGLSANDYTDEEKAKLTDLPTKAELDSDLEGKQDKLTFDTYPTGNSTNPVTSGGVANAVENLNVQINTRLVTELPLKADKTELAELKQKSIPHADAAGYPIMLSDHLSGEKFTKFNLCGSTDGVGTLDSESGKYKIPIVQRGKNLFDISKVNSFVGADYTTSRATYATISDGIVTSKIGAYAAGALWKDSKMKLPAGTYTLSADCMADKDTGNKSVEIMVFDFMLQKSLGKFCALSAYKTWERLSAAFTLENESEIAILIQSVGVKDDYKNMQIKIKNVQLETGSSATGYEEYKEKTVTAILNNALGADEYIDLVNMKLYSADAVSDISVTGDLTSLESESITITCSSDVSPSKMEVTYYQDINKVIEELKNAILSQGGNV